MGLFKRRPKPKGKRLKWGGPRKHRPQPKKKTSWLARPPPPKKKPKPIYRTPAPPGEPRAKKTMYEKREYIVTGLKPMKPKIFHDKTKADYYAKKTRLDHPEAKVKVVSRKKIN